MTAIYCGIGIFSFMLSTYLFYKAAGGLNPGKLNIVSYVYFLFILQTFIGTFLIMAGYDEHYTLKYLIDREKSCLIMYCIVMCISVVLPLGILLVERLLKVNPMKDYKDFLKRETRAENADMLFGVLAVISCFVLILLGWLLVKTGYIPLIKMIHASSEFDFGIERQINAGTVVINSYVTNMLVMSLIPFLSYIAFAYALVVKDWKYRILALVLIISSIIVKTYKFEKSSAIFYLAVLFLIILYYKGGLNFKVIMMCGAGAAGLMVLFYLALGYDGNFLDIYNGPLGRTFFTQVGTLAYTFDAFPAIFSFLGGRSLAPTVLSLLGMNPANHIRSARLMMEFYGSEKVYDGSAGVMNTIFAGEAYANWGFVGILVSVIVVAVMIAIFYILLMKLKKTAVTIAVSACITVKIGTMFQGGFTDFIYNIDLFMTLGLAAIIYYLFETESKPAVLFRKQVKKMSDKLCSILQK